METSDDVDPNATQITARSGQSKDTDQCRQKDDSDRCRCNVMFRKEVTF